MTHSDPVIRGKGIANLYSNIKLSNHLLTAAVIFKVAVYNKFDVLDADSLLLLKGFVAQKLEDAAAVIEALEVLKLFYQRKVLADSEMFPVCVK